MPPGLKAGKPRSEIIRLSWDRKPSWDRWPVTWAWKDELTEKRCVFWG